VKGQDFSSGGVLNLPLHVKDSTVVGDNYVRLSLDARGYNVSIFPWGKIIAYDTGVCARLAILIHRVELAHFVDDDIRTIAVLMDYTLVLSRDLFRNY
jgi:hypothetical protein